MILLKVTFAQCCGTSRADSAFEFDRITRHDECDNVRFPRDSRAADAR
jgi:hypothetical protein